MKAQLPSWKHTALSSSAPTKAGRCTTPPPRPAGYPSSQAWPLSLPLKVPQNRPGLIIPFSCDGWLCSLFWPITPHHLRPVVELTLETPCTLGVAKYGRMHACPRPNPESGFIHSLLHSLDRHILSACWELCMAGTRGRAVIGSYPPVGGQ